MTRNREISQLGEYVQINESTNQINFAGGSISASSFVGDGSGLSAIISTGSGVEIRDDSSLVGVAATINFGDNLTVSPISAGIVTVTGAAGGGGVVNRQTVTATTTSIASGSTQSLSITGYKAYGLLKVGISAAGWLRIYTDSASRTADSSRLQGVDPAPDAGVIAEIISTGNTTVSMSPGIIGWNNDAIPTTTIYASVKNNELTSTTFTISLTLIKLED